jgi:Cys-rich protein (TIGR01571 family)
MRSGSRKWIDCVAALCFYALNHHDISFPASSTIIHTNRPRVRDMKKQTDTESVPLVPGPPSSSSLRGQWHPDIVCNHRHHLPALCCPCVTWARTLAHLPERHRLLLGCTLQLVFVTLLLLSILGLLLPSWHVVAWTSMTIFAVVHLGLSILRGRGRVRLRQQHGIPGSWGCDFTIHCLCPTIAIAQERALQTCTLV